MKQHRERGVSPGGALSVLAVVGVLILVSLPRLQAFALAENEADAAALTRALGQELERRLAPGAPGIDAAAPSLALLAGEAGLDPRRDDVEWLEGGRVLRRHGYLFELAGPPSGAFLRAWPWAYGDTGRAAFAFRPAAGVVRHGNPAGAWTGPGRGPALEGPGWSPVAAEADPTAF
jgi:hypothetical protein